MKICVECGAKFIAVEWRCPNCAVTPPVLEGFTAFAPALASSSPGFKPDYFTILAKLEEDNFWFRSRNRLILWVLDHYFPQARSFLEIGCGTGFVLGAIAKRFPRLALFGSEIYCAGLRYAAERTPRACLFQMDARNIPFADEFDVVGAFDVLEHIEDDERVLKQVYQATRHGGGMMLTVPQHAFLWSKTDDYACHVRRYEVSDLINKVTGVGFTVVMTTSFVSLLLPLMSLSRFVRNRSSAAFDPLAELRIGGLANASMERVLDLERAMIRVGARFPMGGSLLLVARKP